MATQTKKSSKTRRAAPLRELTRLRAEVMRLRAEVSTLKARKSVQTKAGQEQPARGDTVPALPAQDADGNYPAEEALNVIVARQISRRRQALGWTQAELAHRAGVRPETLSRLETGKHAPNVATVDKLDQALRNAGA
jgi:ribosome-binding protein aMBF1 (putative translation factor)